MVTPKNDSPVPTVALVGAGRVGTATAVLLEQAGYSIAGVGSRTPASAQQAAVRLGCPTFDYLSELPDCDLVLLGVSEQAIAETASRISPRLKEGTYVAHFAGSLGVAPLAAVSDVGGHPLALHPVQVCPDVDNALKRLPGSFWGMTCDPQSAHLAEKVVGDLKGTPVFVSEGDRPIWHAAAVTVSNGLAALMAVGESMLAAIGIESPEIVLGPLAAGTIANASDSGGGGATLTGPIVRGEDFVTDRHLEALQSKDPTLAHEYSFVAEMIVRAAANSGRIDDTTAEAMLARLRSKR